jgi:hypothetical protein
MSIFRELGLSPTDVRVLEALVSGDMDMPVKGEITPPDIKSALLISERCQL